MRIYKSVFKDRKTGESRRTSNWYVEFTDTTGAVQRMPALTAKAQSEEFGRKIERLVACRVAGTSIEPDLIRWVESLPPKVNERLLKLDLLDPRFVGSVKALADHLKDFEAVMRSKNNTDTHVDLVVGRVRKVLDGCGFRFWSDVSASRLQTYLAELRRGTSGTPGIGAQTSNFYLKSTKQFLKWMHRDRRAGESPVQHLDGLNVRLDRRHDRRPLSFDEFQWLLDATEKGPERGGVSGAERALIYRVAAETGIRAGELASLTAASFSPDTDPPIVTIQAAHSKHRRMDVIPLKKAPAMLLKQHLASKLPTAPALRVPDKNSRTKILRRDLEAARSAWLAAAPDAPTRAKRAASDYLCYLNHAGRFADFHAFRHATGSFLAQGGVSPKVAQVIMRHSDINLTMSTYSHTLREDEAEAVEKLPDLGRRPEEKRQADAG